MSNKTFTLVGLFTLFIICNAFSQAKQIGIPDFILAENANPIVFLRYPMVHETERGLSVGFGTSYRRSELATIEPNEGIVNYTISVLNKLFLDVGIEPSLYLDVANEYNNHPTNLKYNNAIRKMIYENKAQYVIDLTFMTTPSLSKIKKGKAKITEFVNPIIGIYKYEKGDVSEQEINYSNFFANLETLFNDISKGIKIKPPKFFLKEMPVSEFSQKPFEEFREFDNIPTDLEKNKIAIIEYAGQNSVNSKYESIMKEKYPFEYKLLSQSEKLKQIKKGGNDYKYAMVMRGVNYNKTTHKKNASGQGEFKTTEVSRVYFVIQDLQTFDEYYGMSIEDLENRSQSYAPDALKNAVELIRNAYNIPKGK